MIRHRVCRLAALASLSALAGCSGLPEHSRDFAEIWRFQVDVGAGIEIVSTVGDAWGVDEGLRVAWRIGPRYGDLEATPRVDGSLMRFLSRVRLMGKIEPPAPAGELPRHRRPDPRDVPERGTPLHRDDVEFGFMAGPLGLQLGFSPQEFVDFLAGFLGIQNDPRPFLRLWGEEEDAGLAEEEPLRPLRRPAVKRPAPRPEPPRDPGVAGPARDAGGPASPGRR